MSQSREEVAEGVVQVTIIKTGWFLVEIGRARYTKRFNLAVSEASQLRDLLDEQLSVRES